MEKIFKLNSFEQILVQVLLLSWSFIVLFPLYLTVVNATKTSTGSVLASPLSLPSIKAEGSAYVWGDEGSTIPAGTVMVYTGEDGEEKKYEVLQTVTLTEENTRVDRARPDVLRGRLQIQAMFSGPDGNLRTRNELTMVESIQGVDPVTRTFGRGVTNGSNWTWSNFSTAWVGAEISKYFLNSMIITLSTITIVAFLGSMTSFVLARMPFTGSKIVFVCFLLGMIIPIRLALAPLIVVVETLGLLDTRLSVILVLSAMTMPTAIFILTSFLKGVSPELEQAAMMDGASPFQIYYKVVLPLVKPALATVCLLAFVWAWNEYFLPLIFITDENLMPLPRGLENFRTQFDTQWHLMFSGILIMIVPTIVAFLLASKQFISGLASGGVKE